MSDALPIQIRNGKPLAKRANWLKWTFSLSSVFVAGLETTDLRMLKTYVGIYLKGRQP